MNLLQSFDNGAGFSVIVAAAREDLERRVQKLKTVRLGVKRRRDNKSVPDHERVPYAHQACVLLSQLDRFKMTLHCLDYLIDHQKPSRAQLEPIQVLFDELNFWHRHSAIEPIMEAYNGVVPA